jgi:filamentous hemagglutinin
MEALENATAPFGAGGAVAGTIGKGGRIAWFAKLFSKADEVAKLEGVPGRVLSRINLAKDGMEHIVARHLSGKANASQFSIAEAEVRGLLQSKDVIGTPVTRMIESDAGVRYLREFNAGRAIGFDKFNGGQATSVMTVMTDRFESPRVH